MRNNFINWTKELHTANGKTPAVLVKKIDNDFGFLVRTGNNTFVYSLDKDGRDAMGKRILAFNDFSPELAKQKMPTGNAAIFGRIRDLEVKVEQLEKRFLSPEDNAQWK